MSYREPMRPWPTLTAVAREITLQKSNVRLHIYDAGPQDAPVLVLVHGLGDESDSWRHVIHPLAIHQRVIAPDLPGFGRSEGLPRYAVPDIIDSLLEMLNTLNISRATLIGNSLGGLLSHAIAIEHPDRVEGLVLIDGHLTANKQNLNLGSLLFMVPGIGEWLYNRYRKSPQAAYESLRPFYANLDKLPAEDREFLFQRVNERVWSDRQRKAYLATMRSTASWMVAQQRMLKEKLLTLEVPTLVIFGEQDHIMPLENAYLLPELQPTAHLVTLPSVGHLPQQEAPEALLTSMQNDSGLHILL